MFTTKLSRRSFTKLLGSRWAALAFAGARSLAATELAPAGWRTFEVTTRVEVLQRSGETRVWLPVPIVRGTPFQTVLASDVRCDAGRVQQYSGSASHPGMVMARFAPGVPATLECKQRVATRNWSVPLSPARGAQPASARTLQAYLRPTHYIPTDGVVREKAMQITAGSATDEAKARAIYEWIVEETHRDPKARGCGRGDVRAMLTSNDLGGKCADLNGLFVGLARASGLPARDVYGIRLGPSQQGFRSLGTSSEMITRAQHCRAEVYLTGSGWTPVDPADVRKVVLEETSSVLPLSDSRVSAARTRLFGSWEMNWMAYNDAQDVILPGSSGPPLPFFMYPQAETAEGRLDSLDPESFRYEISARELTWRAA